jgi:predicted ArsR family transcriptional regulator
MTSERQWHAAAMLSDPVRRRLFEHISGSPEPVDRDAAAAMAGISRSLAAFHLDRLAQAGLLEVSYRRRGARSGPGAGRPAKYYGRAPGAALELSTPPRNYELAGSVLAETLEGLGSVDESGVKQVARARGAALIDAVRERGGYARPDNDRAQVIEALRTAGFSPVEADDGGIRLRNCPFDNLVQEHRELVCALNLAMLDGATQSAPGARLVARRDTAQGFCCVSLAQIDQ